MNRTTAVTIWREVCGSDSLMANMPPTGRMLEDFALRIEAAERETMADMQAHRDMLALALREAQCIIGELCACHKHPEPEVTMERIQKALDFDT